MMRIMLMLAAAFLAANDNLFAQANLSSTKRFVSVDGTYQLTSNSLRDGATVRINAEDSRFDSSYEVRSGPAIDVAGGARIWRNLAAAVGVTRFQRNSTSSLTASIPHPFFFGRARNISGNVAGLQREELAVHVQARGVLPVGRRLELMVFG